MTRPLPARLFDVAADDVAYDIIKAAAHDTDDRGYNEALARACEEHLSPKQRAALGTTPGVGAFRDSRDYAPMESPDALNEAIDEDVRRAEEELRGRGFDFDPAELMESFVRHAHGGDLRDDTALRVAALLGDLPEAWVRAVDDALRD